MHGVDSMSLSDIIRAVRRILKMGEDPFNWLRANQDERYFKSITVDLSVARTKVEYSEYGEGFYVNTLDGTCYIILNEEEVDPIGLYAGRKCYTDFYRFFITNTAQAGKTLSLIVFKQGAFDIFDTDYWLNMVKDAQDSMKTAIDDTKTAVDSSKTAIDILAAITATEAKQNEILAAIEALPKVERGMIENAEWNRLKSINATTPVPGDVHINAEGTHLYILDTNLDTVDEYTMYLPWNISSLTYKQAYDHSGESTGARAITLSADGTKLYIDHMWDAPREIQEYTLTTPYDVSTATWIQASTIDTGSLFGMHINEDGTKLYTVDPAGSIKEYTLTTPYDITSMVLENTYSIATVVTSARGLFVSSDGKYLYTICITKDIIVQYEMTTPWDISTLTIIGGVDISTEENEPSGLAINPAGSVLILAGSQADELNEYDLL